MAEAPPAPIFDRCDPTATANTLQGFHRCHLGAGVTDPSFYVQHPGQSPAGGNPLARGPTSGVTPGFNFGLLLLPYVLDWGDVVGIMRRRLAYPTVLHSFARNDDRVYALVTIAAFAAPNDKYFPKFVLHLCGVRAFAGYRWNARALLQWLDFAQGQADALGAPASLDTAAAAAAATAWLASGVRELWEILTIERFPYDAPDLIRYWHASTRPDLP